MSSQTKQFILESRRRLKLSPNKNPRVEIFVSPPSKFSQPSCRVNIDESPYEDYLCVKCKDDQEFVIPKQVARRADYFQRLLDGEGKYRENLENKITLVDIEGSTFEKVLRYCAMDYHLNGNNNKFSTVFQPKKSVQRALFQDNSPISSSPPKESYMYPSPSNLRDRIAFCMDLSHDDVMEILMTSHYLGLPGLVHTCSSMIAKNIDNIDSLNDLPSELVLLIYSFLSPSELYECEYLQKFTESELDTSSLWQSLFERNFEIENILNEWELKLQHLGFQDNYIRTYQPNWKGLYTMHLINSILETINSCLHLTAQRLKKGYPYSTRNQSLLETSRSRLISNLRMSNGSMERFRYRRGEGALNGPGRDLEAVIGCPLDEFFFLMPYLRSIDLVGVDLGLPSSHGHHLQITHIIHHIRKNSNGIKVLSLSNCGLTDKSLVYISELFEKDVEKPTIELEDLKLDNNNFTANGIQILAESLKRNLILKRLSLVNVFKPSSSSLNPLLFLFDLLGHNPSLEMLDLSRNNLHLHDLVEEDFYKLRSNDNLKYLWLNENEEILSIEKLNEKDNEMDNWSRFLRNLPQGLISLALSSCGLENLHLLLLSQIFATDSTLQLRSLDLSSNNIGDTNPEFLSQLINNQFLESLNLFDTDLRENSGRIIAEALAKPNQLKRLDLERNALGGTMISIASAVSNNPNRMMKYLLFSSNLVPIGDAHSLSCLLRVLDTNQQ